MYGSVTGLCVCVRVCVHAQRDGVSCWAAATPFDLFETKKKPELDLSQSLSEGPSQGETSNKLQSQVGGN